MTPERIQKGMTKPQPFDMPKIEIAPNWQGADWTLPDTVYILGSGATAAEAIWRIPSDACVIALNKAILAYQAAKIWMCTTSAYLKEEWWQHAFSMPAIRLFSEHLSVFAEADYSFLHYPPWGREPQGWIPGVLRIATIAGCAVNLCYFKGVKKIVLCGVDMYGDTYFDGTTSNHKFKKNSIWREQSALDSMFRAVKKEGIVVVSLTDTYLREVDVG